MFQIGGIAAIFLAFASGVSQWFITIPLFLAFTAFHAGVQYRVLNMQAEGLDWQLRTAIFLRGARIWFFFVGFTLANTLLEVYVRFFQQTS